MTRRFDVGPVLVALAAIALLVSLFLDWYGPLSAWQAFEVAEILLAALAIAALVAAIGQLVPDLGVVEPRLLPGLVIAITVLVAAEIIDPPPAAGPETPSTGAWLAFASALVMLIGTVLAFGRVSFAVSVEGRETRERVAVVDHRQDTTESAPVRPDAEPRRSIWRGSVPGSTRAHGEADRDAEDRTEADEPAERSGGGGGGRSVGGESAERSGD